jgi:hypothetical protein
MRTALRSISTYVEALDRLNVSLTPRPDASSFGNTSFEATQETSTIAALAKALWTNDRAALQRGWLIRNRRHPLSPP